jgi:hypothetical protein
LPPGWRELAKETAATRRRRGELQDPQVLLQVLLLHIATGLSLKQAAARATAQGLAKLSDVALLKRLRSSEGWLREMTRRMFEDSRFTTKAASLPSGRRLRAIDATTIEEPGSTGTDWRVHYSISLPQMECDFYEVTDAKGGETYLRFPLAPGDILLGDRGYCHREGVAHVLMRGGDVIVRLNCNSFPLMHSSDYTPFELLPQLRRLEHHQPGEWEVCFETTLGEDEASKTAVLELYRARWQIELCFKRLKSLLRLGHVPKRSDLSARAFIEGKLLTVLLIERLLDQARFFSPWGFDLALT